MPSKKPPKFKKQFFSSIQEAREIIRAGAVEYITMQKKIIEEALKAGDYETAAKANQWLIEHAPADSDGARIIDQSVDKPKESDSKPTGPQINIGFALGGLNQPKELPPPETKQLPSPEVIDVEPEATES